jgi:hypothetical protein
MPKKNKNLTKQQKFWIILALIIAIVLFSSSSFPDDRLVRAEQPDLPTAADLAEIPVRVGDKFAISENFVVSGLNAAYYAKLLEYYKKELGSFWFGIDNPPAYLEKVNVTIHEGNNLGAGGVTSFLMTNKGPVSMNMTVQGSRTRLTDSVIPHEVNHLNWVQRFKVQIPRWIDEGNCTTLECLIERKKLQKALIEFLTTDRGIAFGQMLNMTAYPKDILPLYAQGTSAVEYLIAIGGGDQKGRLKLVAFLDDYFINVQRIKSEEAWSAALLENYGEYGVKDASDFQVKWLAAVAEGGVWNEFKDFIPRKQPEMAPVILPPQVLDLDWERVPPEKEDEEIEALQEALKEVERISKELEAEKERLKKELEALQLKNL